MHCSLLVIPIIGAIAGWLLFKCVSKSLFHPKKASGLFGIKGILPANQNAIAVAIGKWAEEFMPLDKLEEKATHPDSIANLMPFVEGHIDEFLRKKLTAEMPMLSMFISDKLVDQLKGIFMKELEELFPLLMKSYMQNLRADLNLRETVSNKLASLSLDELEERFNTRFSKKLNSLALMAGLIGFIIGCLQVAILVMTQKLF